MKKWQYKVVPWRNMFGDSSDHDINVSVEKGKDKAGKGAKEMEKALGKLGTDGWELVASYRDFALFKKEK
ncbi:hypothetical protein [Candidatus Mycalebacterium sp.]